jgi:hypothetical protein
MYSVILAFFALFFIAVIYFIPSIVAHNKRNFGAIFVLNLFLGWTGIGWLGALIWAMVEKPLKK